MLPRERHKLLVLMSLHLLWGAILCFSISKYGLGVSTDAVHLIFGGLNLASGNGLTTYDGGFVGQWPPLYVLLLGIVRWATRLDMLAVASIIQVLAFLGLGISLAVLFLRIFPENFALAAVAMGLAETGSAVFLAAGTVGSDYLHLCLVMLLLLLTGTYIESRAGSIFVALAIASMLVTLQRYLGVAALATAAATILLLAEGTLLRRMGSALVLASTALPMAAWLAITSQVYGRRDPISLAENLAWFSRSVLEWFLGPIQRKENLMMEAIMLWSACLVLAAVALILADRRRPTGWDGAGEDRSEKTPWPYLLPLMLYGVFYVAALFGSASIAYFNKLGGRFILPLYVPLISVPVVAADGIIRLAKRSGSGWRGVPVGAACYGVLAGLAILVLGTTLPLARASRAGGVPGADNSFNLQGWRDNPVLMFWMDHEPAGNYLLFTNEPDAVAFHTRRAVNSAPRRMTGPYGTEVIPISESREDLFGAGVDVYLLWIEPGQYDYFYTPAELTAIADLDPLFTSEQGSLYRLRPLAASQ